MSAISDISAVLSKIGRKKKKGKSGRKVGRTKSHRAFQRYASEDRLESNRLIRLARHLKYFPADLQARRAVDAVKGYQGNRKPVRKGSVTNPPLVSCEFCGQRHSRMFCMAKPRWAA